MGRTTSQQREARALLMRPGPVSIMFRVDPKTVVRWAILNKIASIRTPGGQYMFRRVDVAALVGEDVLSGRVRLLRPDEVGSIFEVDPKTAVRWVAEGKLSSIRTPGGHHRFRDDEVRSYLEGNRPQLKETA